MKRDLLRVSIRQKAVFISKNMEVNGGVAELNETTGVLLANCSKLGFTFSEELLHKINGISPKAKLGLLDLLKEITGVNKNWTPLVKQWDIPTGETLVDHIVTWFANVFQSKNGTILPCGHLIPKHTFPLERYNGCPFCGTPFEFEKLVYKGGQNKLKTLELWTEDDVIHHLKSLLESSVALDATQADNLKILLGHYALPVGVEIKMKETLMLAIDALVEHDKGSAAGQLFHTPNDILRYLWYKHTGFLQIIEPKTIKARMAKNAQNFHPQLDKSSEVKVQAAQELKLKFGRTASRRYATWLNDLKMDIKAQCENMHPKRGIWVRVIRALRLAEYSKRKGFEQLARLLDDFYNENYEVWQGKVNESRLKMDADTTFRLLKQRPGLFARSLFSTMLWFGPEAAIKEFRTVMDKIPARLIFTLNMYAEVYFDKNQKRTAKPLGGINKRIPVNPLLQLYEEKDLRRMQKLVQGLSLEVIKGNFAKAENPNRTIFIAEGLDKIPIAIGDRSEQLQDLPEVPVGTRFKVEGETVRLFLQWGEGLPAQHLDMDLSCWVIYENKNYPMFCSYAQLDVPGCSHSGDIQSIPDQVGTAEYIEIDFPDLTIAAARYVIFTCNSYTIGSLSPNLVVGWMNSKDKMDISHKGVAYDPTAVQHQVRIKQSLTKGMVFGVLDVEKKEIIWMEMNFGGQVVQNMNQETLEGLLQKLDAKLKVGDLLKLKAEVQQLEVVTEPEQADEVYDLNWALNTAEVSKLFMGS
ncbi:hypothetical protein [Flexithrix dorotheae]|uniref:hypothetical protein n=1 Tax=Flexithrix dorotheae TaxID=70993 RepID=UPI00037A527E|nr:hypothetical protein [Flexithrix dorotheae]